MNSTSRITVAFVACLAVLAAGCGGGSGGEGSTSPGGDRPSVAVTTNILGDVVEQMVGDHVEVITIIPVGADPHDFQPSAQQVAQIGTAQALIANGASFEDGLHDILDSAERDRTPLYEAITAVSTIDFGDDDHDDDHHDDEDEHHDDDHEHHDDDHEHHDDDHEHEHKGVDPHFFTDPSRMAIAAAGIVDFLAENLDGVDVDAMRADAADYIGELEALDAEVTETLAVLGDDERVLVTNHEVFGYFADRYDFEVVGTVIPSGSTADGANAQALAELAETIEDERVRAIFSDTSSSDELVETLADEVGSIAIVELFTESLGDADSEGSTYLDMVRTNAERIAAALDS